MPVIDLTVNPNLRSTHGGYVHDGQTAKTIEVKPGLGHAAFAITHEVGHFLDHQGLGTGGRGFSSRGDSEDTATVMTAIRASKETKLLRRNARVFGGPVLGYVKYLIRPEELFARAYSQYVTKKSHSPALVAGLKSDSGGFFGPMSHWSDRSFRRICEAFDSLFSEKGWSR